MNELEYRTRRTELQQHIEAAEADHARLAYTVELGEATSSDLEASRAAVSELRDRLNGLELVRRDSCVAQDAATARAERQEVRQVVAEAERLCDRRLATARKLAAAAAVVGALHKDFLEDGEALKGLRARPLAPKDREEIAWSVNSPGQEELTAIGGLLQREGLDLRSVAICKIADDDRDLVGWVELKNRRIRSVFRDIDPGDEEQEAEAA